MSGILTNKRIQELASAEVMENMHLVNALKRDPAGDDGYDGSNLVALLECFAQRLLSEQSGDAERTIDSSLGEGWTRKLAEHLHKPK